MGSDQSAVRSWQGSDRTADWSLPIAVLIWVRSFIEPDLFKDKVPFDNNTPIHLINLLWKLGLGLGLESQLHYFSIFSRRMTKMITLSSANFTDGNILLKECTQTIKNKTYSRSARARIRQLANFISQFSDK